MIGPLLGKGKHSGERSSIELQVMNNEQHIPTEVKVEESEIPHDHTESSLNGNDLNAIDNAEPPLKRRKIESEKIESEEPAPIISNTEPKIKSEHCSANAETPTESDQSRSNSTLVTQQTTLPVTTVQTTTAVDTSIEVIKQPADSKHAIPTQTQPSKADLVRQSGRTVEDIIDGSDLRKFLNIGLTEYIVKGLDEVVALWEKGKFSLDGQEPSKEVLKKKVALQFADIIKQLAEK